MSIRNRIIYHKPQVRVLRLMKIFTKAFAADITAFIRFRFFANQSDFLPAKASNRQIQTAAMFRFAD